MKFDDIEKHEKLPDEIKDIIYSYKIILDNQKANIIIKHWRKYKKYSELMIDKILESIKEHPYLPIEIDNNVYCHLRKMMKYLNITNYNYLNYEHIFTKLIMSYYHNYEHCIINQYYGKPINEIDDCLEDEILEIDLKKLKIASIYIQELGYKLLLKQKKSKPRFYNNSIVECEYKNHINNENYCNIFNDEYINDLLTKIQSIKDVINRK